MVEAPSPLWLLPSISWLYSASIKPSCWLLFPVSLEFHFEFLGEAASTPATDSGSFGKDLIWSTTILLPLGLRFGFGG